MELFSPQYWPVWFICVAMIASGVIDWWIFKVPNLLTFPVILSGWAYGLVHTCGGHLGPENGVGTILDSLGGTFLGLALLLPVYAIGGMGAGDVKMTMGFGAWIGAFYGLHGRSEAEPGYLSIVFYAFVAGVLVGGVIGLVMIFLRRQFDRNIQHTKEIVGDLWNAPGEAAARAQVRRSRWHRLPYGVPLCIGFVGYLWLAAPPPAPPTSLEEVSGHPTTQVARLAGEDGFYPVSGKEPFGGIDFPSGKLGAAVTTKRL